jgi:hypothetical protein
VLNQGRKWQQVLEKEEEVPGIPRVRASATAISKLGKASIFKKYDLLGLDAGSHDFCNTYKFWRQTKRTRKNVMKLLVQLLYSSPTSTVTNNHRTVRLTVTSVQCQRAHIDGGVSPQQPLKRSSNL